MVRLIPDLLSLSRVVMAWPLYRMMQSPEAGDALVAAALFVLAIATDLADGRLARRLGTTSARGRVLDHSSDVIFVIAGLAGAASRGALTGWLPVLVGIAFAQYATDSWLIHRSGGLRMSRLGRWNGILYFFPTGGDILVRLGLGFLAPPVAWLAVALCLTSLLSMAERARAMWLPRIAPGSHGEGTADRSSR